MGGPPNVDHYPESQTVQIVWPHIVPLAGIITGISHTNNSIIHNNNIQKTKNKDTTNTKPLTLVRGRELLDLLCKISTLNIDGGLKQLTPLGALNLTAAPRLELCKVVPTIKIICGGFLKLWVPF